MTQDLVERAFLSALRANMDRPPVMPSEEDVLDGYVWGVERAAYCIAVEFDRADLIAKWISR